MHKHIRKIVSTVLIAAMLFFAPSMIPAGGVAVFPCGFDSIVLLPAVAAFAGADLILPAPCPSAPVSHVPAWFWAAFEYPASIILSGTVANFKDNRHVPYAEA